ncbi:unnamed protein product [Leuciscus chuanchicus]
MAPVCKASRLSASRCVCFLFAAVLFLCFCCRDVTSLLVYDRQTLFDIRVSCEALGLSRDRLGEQAGGLPPWLFNIPDYLRCVPCDFPRKKRHRRRGRRGGVLVRLRAYLRSSDVPHPHLLCGGGCGRPAVCGCRCSEVPRLRWIRPVFPSPIAVASQPVVALSSLTHGAPWADTGRGNPASRQVPHRQLEDRSGVEGEAEEVVQEAVQLGYKRVDTDGHPRQYAIAIDVPKEQCQQNFFPEKNNFLPQENAAIVKNAINDDSNALYQGSELIAAGTRKVVISKKKQYNIHSESLLLNPADNSPMSKLLNKKKEDSCSILYTLNSPCVNMCLDATGSHNIINALEKWKEHDGIKALVFKDFYKLDTEKDLQAKFKQIVAHVPLFRCVSENECYACKGEGNTPIDARCLPPKKTNSKL